MMVDCDDKFTLLLDDELTMFMGLPLLQFAHGTSVHMHNSAYYPPFRLYLLYIRTTF